MPVFSAWSYFSALMAWPLAWQMTQEKKQRGSSEAPFLTKLCNYTSSLLLYFVYYHQVTKLSPTQESLLERKSIKGFVYITEHHH